MSFRVRPSAVIVRIGLRWLAEEVADLKVRIALLPEILDRLTREEEFSRRIMAFAESINDRVKALEQSAGIHEETGDANGPRYRLYGNQPEDKRHDHPKHCRLPAFRAGHQGRWPDRERNPGCRRPMRLGADLISLHSVAIT
jgi:hypothetical protein